jgi:hypothetical protein
MKLLIMQFLFTILFTSQQNKYLKFSTFFS